MESNDIHVLFGHFVGYSYATAGWMPVSVPPEYTEGYMYMHVNFPR